MRSVFGKVYTDMLVTVNDEELQDDKLLIQESITFIQGTILACEAIGIGGDHLGLVLCQAFTAAAFSCCLFSVRSLVFKK